MGTIEREAQREDLRARIVEAARDIVSEKGLDGLSMRALAIRIEHSPGTIYHHFRDKQELLDSVLAEGYKRLEQSMAAAIEEAGPEASPLERFAAQGRGYARFALEHTGYFRAMFEVPGVANLEACPEAPGAGERVPEASSREHAVELLRTASDAGEVDVGGDPERAAVVGWALIHGLTSLYVSGHLAREAATHEEFMELVENAIQALGAGWRPR